MKKRMEKRKNRKAKKGKVKYPTPIVGADSIRENSEKDKFIFTRQVLADAPRDDAEHSDTDSESDTSIVTEP